MKKRQRRQGFTLIEVLLVLAILVVMGAMVTLHFGKTREGANKRAAKVQIQAFEQQLRLYNLDVGTYPDPQSGLQALREPPGNLANQSAWQGPYIEKEIPNDPWGNPYKYDLGQDVGGNRPIIRSGGPDGILDTEDDVVNS